MAAGATQVVPVEEAYGWRVGRVVDPFGHHWEIGGTVERRVIRVKRHEEITGEHTADINAVPFGTITGVNAEFCSLTGARTFVDTNLVYLEVLGGEIASLLRGSNPKGVDHISFPTSSTNRCTTGVSTRLSVWHWRSTGPNSPSYQ